MLETHLRIRNSELGKLKIKRRSFDEIIESEKNLKGFFRASKKVNLCSKLTVGRTTIY